MNPHNTAGETVGYFYDHLDRLTAATSASLAETYGYNEIGCMTTRNGVTQHFPTAGSPRPHAPNWVVSSANAYSYDENGNLTSAEGRTYEYDVENRLSNAYSGGVLLQSYDYDGEGNLRALWQGDVLTRRYLTPDYQIDVATGEPSVNYRFGGKIVASASGATLRYVLTDHLGSAHAELDALGAETGQRRYYPYGSDRVVIGANDLSRDERYTGQKRLSDGAGNPRAELYHYGARFYLPGVGVFTQPDTIVPKPSDPQALNRFSYVRCNPVLLTDPTGHDWAADYWADHHQWPNEVPGAVEAHDFSLSHPGDGSNGAWTPGNWQAYGTALNYGWSPSQGLYKTHGTMSQRLRLATAITVLRSSQSGGKLGDLASQTDILFEGFLSSAIGNGVTYAGAIQLGGFTEKWSVEALAARVGHETLHSERQSGRFLGGLLPPFTGESEENDAYKTEWAIWNDVKRGRTDGDWLGTWRDSNGGFYRFIQRTEGPYYTSLPVIGPFRYPWVGD